MRSILKKLNPFSWKMRNKILGLILLVGIASGYWFLIRPRLESNEEEQQQTMTVEKGTITNSLTLSGQIENSNLISVYTKASGVVSKVYVTDGQNVQAGDVLAEITLDTEGQNNQASAWASYLNAKKNVETAQASQYSSHAQLYENWDQFINLSENDTYEDPNSINRTLPEFIVSQDQWLASEATYKLQTTNIQSSQASLSQSSYNYQLYQSTIKAPVDGIVVGLNLAEGLTISFTEGNTGVASQTVATIKTEGTPVASFQATEIDINKLIVGQIVDISLDNFPDQTFAGTIAAVDRVGTQTNGVTQYPVLIKIDSEDPKILTNMAVTATIVFEQKEGVIVIPLSAVTTMGDRSIVRVMKDGQIQPVQVETGIESDTMAEITSGLSEGDIILTGSIGQAAQLNQSGDRPMFIQGGGGGLGGGS
ncbi:MAG: efflux RND transporter periplasmic adaptor subunit, partial [Candidatus Roizmanbacteria bacterium]|nr:efflux RND transporter periplasmic adaptor subunit [Candidatus Roizmanbacteria bacterium]